MAPSPDNPSSCVKRAFLTSGLALGLSLCLQSRAHGQTGLPASRQARTRIPITATGQSAISRFRGRLQIAYDDLDLVFGAPLYLRIVKEQRRLEIWVQGRRQNYVRLRTYRLCGTRPPIGPRQRGAATSQPEGFYTLGATSLRPQPVTYLGIDINWPNAFDRAQGGAGASSLLQAGCVGAPHFGLTDQDMEEVYTLVHSALTFGQTGVPLHIFPFEMNRLRMMQSAQAPHIAFWRTLEPAWRLFERTKKPPQVRILGRRYVVTEG